MKPSEILKQQAEQEENDLKAIGIYTKVMREERYERFEQWKDKILAKGYNVTEYEANGKITIEPTDFGIIDYFPKANKVLIRKSNEWKTMGLKWIINNLIL